MSDENNRITAGGVPEDTQHAGSNSEFTADVRNETISALGSSSTSSIEGLPIGATINDRYVIDRELGRGGIGVVYVAHDKQLLSKPVVVKVLLGGAQTDDWLRKKFRQEVEALARVDHPGIVGILDAGELPDGKAFLVMQFIDGASLRKLMQPEGMPFERVAEILKQMGRALNAAHERGVLHRDLKPENVMVQTLADGEDQVKIIDFGIARIKDSVIAPETMTKLTVGTIAYMSPEQLTAAPVTAASDVYALGLIAYEMLTGRKPFNPQSMFQLLEFQRAGLQVAPHRLRPGIPPAAETAIVKALEFDQERRYQSAKQFCDDLAAALLNPSAAGAARGAADRGEADLAVQALAETVLQNADPQTQRDGSPATLPHTQVSETSVPERASTSPEVRQQVPEPTPSNRGVLLLVGTVVVLGIVAVVAWAFWPPAPALPVDTPPGPVEPMARRELTYSLTVQKMRDGKPYQEPFQATGQEIFEGGYQFWMNFASPQEGHLYLINQGPEPRNGMTSYNVLYPVAEKPSRVAANQTVSIPPRDGYGFVFDEKEKGTEKMWIVWSAEPVAELEAVTRYANAKDQGVVSDPKDVAAVEAFLKRNANSKADIQADDVKTETRASVAGDVLVHLQNLRHQ